MKLRVAAAASLIVLAVVGLLVIVWPSNSDRTERILDVYAEQLDLTRDEARQEREAAIDLANFYCSIEPGNLVEFMAGTTTPVEDAIAYAEAACPETAREFKEEVEPDQICELARESARLTAGQTSLSEDERRERLDEIASEFAATGPPEIRDFYVTVGTLDDLPPSEREAAMRDLSREIGAYLSQRCS